MSRFVTIPQDTPIETARDEISRNNGRLASLGHGVKVIGELLFTAAEAEEVGSDTAARVGYLLDEIGDAINETLSMNARLYTHIQIAEQEVRK